MKILFFVCIFLLTAAAVFTQGKVVTNADLDKYRIERIKAAAEYRENFVKLGLPSPEELDRRNEQSRKELAEVSAKIRADRRERERLEAEIRYVEYFSTQRNEIVWENRFPAYFYPTGHYSYDFGQREYMQPGYFAGGQFWPSGSIPRNQTRPQFIRPRN